MGACQSRTKGKVWEKCGQTAPMLVKAFVFTWDFLQFLIFYVSVLIPDPNFEFTTPIVKGNSIVPRTTSFSVLILHN